MAAINRKILPAPSQPRMITSIALEEDNLFSLAMTFSSVNKLIMSALTETMP